MYKKNLSLFLMLIFISSFFTMPSVAMPAISLPEKENKNVILMADNVKFNNKKKKGNYLGHVYIKQGSSILHANTAVTYSDTYNQLLKAIANGKNNINAKFETIPEGETKKLTGNAKKITYYPKKRIVQLDGNAILIHGKNTYRSEIIIYDIDHKKLISTKKPHKRTTIIFNEKIA